MKNKTLGLALAALLIAWAPLIASTPAVPWFTPPKQGEDPSYDSSTREKLATLKVSVQWNSVPLKAALEYFAPPGFGIKAKLSVLLVGNRNHFAPPGFGIKAKQCAGGRLPACYFAPPGFGIKANP